MLIFRHTSYRIPDKNGGKTGHLHRPLPFVWYYVVCPSLEPRRTTSTCRMGRLAYPSPWVGCPQVAALGTGDGRTLNALACTPSALLRSSCITCGLEYVAYKVPLEQRIVVFYSRRFIAKSWLTSCRCSVGGGYLDARCCRGILLARKQLDSWLGMCW